MAQQPDWKDLIQAKLDRIPQSSRNIPVRTSPPVDAAVKQAARLRNMTVSAYARRAIAAFAAHDTGISWEELMFHEPGFGLYGETPGRGAIRAEGHGFGPWNILELGKHYADD